MNHWLLLLVAAALEVVWALTIKTTEGYTRLWPSLFNATLGMLNVVVLSKAMHGLPAGTAYAVWVGLGSIGVVLGGILLFGESISTSRILFMGIIIIGIVGLKFVSNG